MLSCESRSIRKSYPFKPPMSEEIKNFLLANCEYMTASELSQAVSYSQTTILNFLKKHNKKTKKSVYTPLLVPLTSVQISEIIRLYCEEQKPLSAIRLELHIPMDRVKATLVENGIPLRKSKHSLYEDKKAKYQSQILDLYKQGKTKYDISKYLSLSWYFVKSILVENGLEDKEQKKTVATLCEPGEMCFNCPYDDCISNRGLSTQERKLNSVIDKLLK